MATEFTKTGKSKYPKVGGQYKPMTAMVHHQWMWGFVSLVWENSLALSSQATDAYHTS